MTDAWPQPAHAAFGLDAAALDTLAEIVYDIDAMHAPFGRAGVARGELS